MGSWSEVRYSPSIRHLFSIQHSTRKKLLAKYASRTDQYITIEKAQCNYAMYTYTTLTLLPKILYRSIVNFDILLFTKSYSIRWNLEILHCDAVFKIRIILQQLLFSFKFFWKKNHIANKHSTRFLRSFEFLLS